MRCAHLGVSGGSSVPLHWSVVLAYGLTQNSGVRFVAVEPGRRADQASLREGGVTIGLDGIDIDSVNRLHRTLDASRVRRERSLRLLLGQVSPQPHYVIVKLPERN